MRQIFYMSLEEYQERYTFQLTEWSKRAFERNGVKFTIVPGSVIDTSKEIKTGQVLDAHGRSYFGMSQMMNLVQLMRDGNVTGEDVIFFEDMFQPGIESLPYIMDQIPEENRPKVWVRCLAQSIDPDDFVHVTGMDRWMRHYEAMVNEFVTGVLASNEEMVPNMRIAGWKAPIYNISGLAFDKDEVRERVIDVQDFNTRTKRVIFSSRWDAEKNPDFYMDLIERVHAKNPEIEFALLQGGPLRSNNHHYVERARELESRGLLKIHERLQKNEYYAIVNDSRVLVNNALQDWTSNTVSEADALGCNVLFPAYRSFPEIFNNDETRLYVPWSLDDAERKLYALLDAPSPNMGKISDWTHATIDRYVAIMRGEGEQWRRDGKFYREHVTKNKY